MLTVQRIRILFVVIFIFVLSEPTITQSNVADTSKTGSKSEIQSEKLPGQVKKLGQEIQQLRQQLRNLQQQLLHQLLQQQPSPQPPLQNVQINPLQAQVDRMLMRFDHLESRLTQLETQIPAGRIDNLEFRVANLESQVRR